MLARGPSSAPLPRCLTCRVLRIRQPASLRLALIELEMGPSRVCRSDTPAANLEYGRSRTIALPERLVRTRIAAPR
jgi:hypothetical protein